jgi:hypothetical protein
MLRMWTGVLRHVLVIAVLGVLGLTLAACGSSEGSSGEASPEAAAGFAVGDSVAAVWNDGSYYLAAVTEVEGDEVTVVYADDGTSKTLKTTDLRAIPRRTFAVGDRVLAVWGNGRFYAGEIGEADGDTYTVVWDDGGTPSELDVTKIIAE